MHDDSPPAQLIADLKNGDEDQLREVIRLGEKFLDSQLQAGIAGDQRATTFASIISVLAAALIGFYVAEDSRTMELGWAILPAAAILLMSAVLASLAARPTGWWYSGNDPSFWAADLVAKKSLRDSLAEQAAYYDISIKRNRAVLAACSDMINIAMAIAAAGILYALVGAATL
ncbi:MAG: hypothetical protein AB7O56_06070 [Bauldia sp.]